LLLSPSRVLLPWRALCSLALCRAPSRSPPHYGAGRRTYAGSLLGHGSRDPLASSTDSGRSSLPWQPLVCLPDARRVRPCLSVLFSSSNSPSSSLDLLPLELPHAAVLVQAPARAPPLFSLVPLSTFPSSSSSPRTQTFRHPAQLGRSSLNSPQPWPRPCTSSPRVPAPHGRLPALVPPSDCASAPPMALGITSVSPARRVSFPTPWRLPMAPQLPGSPAVQLGPAHPRSSRLQPPLPGRRRVPCARSWLGSNTSELSPCILPAVASMAPSSDFCLVACRFPVPWSRPAMSCQGCSCTRVLIPLLAIRPTVSSSPAMSSSITPSTGVSPSVCCWIPASALTLTLRRSCAVLVVRQPLNKMWCWPPHRALYCHGTDARILHLRVF
jgi:hypothetical protein